MSEVARRATYQDLLAVPDHLVAEILDGELLTFPRPASRRARAASRLGAELDGPFDGDFERPDRPGGWWILDEPELHLEDDVVVPDLAAWRRERMPVYPDVSFFELAPDWVCEVLSPGTEAVDRGRKRRIYARAGVRYLWMLNPVSRTLEVFRLDGSVWTLLATFVGDETIRAEPFEAVPLEMARWWVPEAPGGPTR
jgi:Uma2 family endonuclease